MLCCCEVDGDLRALHVLIHSCPTRLSADLFQAKSRAVLPQVEIEDGRLNINPLADWDKERLDSYFAEHDLPRHPLEAEGYLSIGCVPCTSTVKPGEDPRAGRWRGWDKVECGIHGSDGDRSELPVF